MTVAQSVRSQVGPGCITRRCRKGKCAILLGGTSRQSFAIDMDHPEAPTRQAVRRCDFLFVGSLVNDYDEWVVPLELKEGDVRVSEVRLQLQAGASVADGLVPQGAAVNFRPVVVSGRIHKSERAKLRNLTNRIAFRGQRRVITRLKCGTQLAVALRGP